MIREDSTMLLIFLLSVLGLGHTLEAEVSMKCSTCILANNTCYNVSHILDLEAPFRKHVVIHKMGILRSDNKLFFSFEPVIEDEEYFKVGFVNLDNHTVAGVITSPDSIMNFGTFDIDQDKNLVYFGGSDGIFVLDTRANKLKPYSSHGESIQSLFYKKSVDNVFFTKYNDLGIVEKKNDEFLTVLEYIPVNNFVVNKYDVIVFQNRYGLHVGQGELLYRLSRNPFFRGIISDLDGNIFAWWVDGIYKVVIEKNLYYSKIVKLVDIPMIGAMAFDNENNILVTIDKGLYKMTQSPTGCGLVTAEELETV